MARPRRGLRLRAPPRPPQDAAHSQRSSSPTRAVWPSRVRMASASRRAGERLLRRPGQVASTESASSRPARVSGSSVVGHGERGAVVLGRLAVGPAALAARGRGRAHGPARRRGPPARRAWWTSRARSTPSRSRSAASTRRSSSRRAQRRQLRLDAGPGDLVAEPHHLAVALQHPGGQARLEGLARGAERGLDQPQLGAARHHGRPARSPPGPPGRGAPRGPARRRAPSRGTPVRAAASTSVTKNGLPPVARWISSAATAGAPRQLVDRPRGERRQVDAAHQARRQLAHGGRAGRDRPRRCGRSPAGCPSCRHPAPQHRQQVERAPRRPSGRPR